MRFLIGIITGAIITLFIATAVDAPTDPTLDRAQQQLGSLWDGLIDSTSGTLFPVREAVPEQIAALEPDPLELKSPQPFLDPARAGGPLESPDHAALRTVAEEPATALSAPEPLPAAPPVMAARRAEPATLDALLAESASADPEATAMESLPAENIQSTDSQLAESGRAAVWEPFHSQMSAEGFAARLSEELDYPFSVERQGAGAYQVVFATDSSIERELVLAQIAEITGR